MSLCIFPDPPEDTARTRHEPVRSIRLDTIEPAPAAGGHARILRGIVDVYDEAGRTYLDWKWDAVACLMPDGNEWNWLAITFYPTNIAHLFIRDDLDKIARSENELDLLKQVALCVIPKLTAFAAKRGDVIANGMPAAIAKPLDA